jgi:hypothetical protein
MTTLVMTLDLEDYKIPYLSASLPYLGSQLHIIAAAFLAIMLWFRLYYVRSSGRKTIDKLEPAGESDTQSAKEHK